MKTCARCREEKPEFEFYREAKQKDGYNKNCKACVAEYFRKRRNGPAREKVLASERKRESLPHRVEKIRKVAARRMVEHPDRYKAKFTLNNAVRAGKVTPMPCFVCGEKAEAHHPDYSSPLDVVWLCKSHHMQTHAMVRGM